MSRPGSSEEDQSASGLSESPVVPSPVSKPVEAPASGGDPIRAHIRSYWDKTEFADVEVHASNGKVFHLHRLVLAQSEFFRLAFSRNFNAETRKIDLPEDDPVAVEIMLLHMYGYGWQTCMKTVTGFDEAVCLEVCLIADKYDLDSLQKVASKEFSWYIPRLLKANKKSLLWSLLPRLFSGPEKLMVRSRALTMLHDHSAEILGDPSSARELFTSCPEIAAELIMHAGLGKGRKKVDAKPKSVVPQKRAAERE